VILPTFLHLCAKQSSLLIASKFNRYIAIFGEKIVPRNKGHFMTTILRFFLCKFGLAVILNSHLHAYQRLEKPTGKKAIASFNESVYSERYEYGE
jgi:hypothetical protein